MKRHKLLWMNWNGLKMSHNQKFFLINSFLFIGYTESLITNS